MRRRRILLVGREAAGWARLLGAMGHGARPAPAYDGEPYDVLVLPAREEASAAAAVRFRDASPGGVLLVTLSREEAARPPEDPRTRGLLVEADVLLVPEGVDPASLPAPLRARARAVPRHGPEGAGEPSTGAPPASVPAREAEDDEDVTEFQVCLLDRAGGRGGPGPAAVRRLPEASRLRLVGAAVAAHGSGGRAVGAEEAPAGVPGAPGPEPGPGSDPRWLWLGPVPAVTARRLALASRLVVAWASADEVLGVAREALAAGVPTAAARGPDAEALLGADHPGLFAPADAAALAALLRRAETDAAWLRWLGAAARRRVPDPEPGGAAVRRAWAELLEEL